MRRLASVVDQSGAETRALVTAVAAVGEVDFRSRAGVLFRRRLSRMDEALLTAARSADAAADALRDHAAAVEASATVFS